MGEPVQKIVDMLGVGGGPESRLRKEDVIREQLDSKNVKDKQEAMNRLIEVRLFFCRHSIRSHLQFHCLDDDERTRRVFVFP
jgi:hypothetical protein